MDTNNREWSFEKLVGFIRQVHGELAALIQEGAETAEPKLAIRDPYIFEFLGLEEKVKYSESDLEAAIIDKLENFLLELGIWRFNHD